MEDREIHSLAITIGGQKYDIRTSGDREKTLKIAAEADRKVSELLGGRLTYQQALVLALLDYAMSAEVNAEDAGRFRTELGEYLKDAEDAKLECEKLKRENTILKERLRRES